MKDLRSLGREELKQAMARLGEKPFRGEQVFRWVQGKQAQSFEEMTDLSKDLRDRLQENFSLHPLKLREKKVSRDGTAKYLWELADGQTVETVLMEYQRQESRDRNTLCVSTQVGCPMACAFCATAIGGFIRNLRAGEIVSQVLDVQRERRQEDPEFTITNVVFMGMGEPLANYEETLQAIRILNDEKGMGIGQRRMTLSTSGLVPQMDRLAKEGLQIVLAISLHGADDETRSTLMPVNRRYPLEELTRAMIRYEEGTGRRVTLEYALMAGVNDREKDARNLAALARKLPIPPHINLIPINPVQETGFGRPSRERLTAFHKLLAEAGLEVTLREERGADIDGACGQLRRRLETAP